MNVDSGKLGVRTCRWLELDAKLWSKIWSRLVVVCGISYDLGMVRKGSGSGGFKGARGHSSSLFRSENKLFS